MKHLEQLFKMKRMLKYHSRVMGHTYECTVNVLDFTAPYTDSEGYSYPALFDVNIENWSTWKGNFRPDDGMWIREGRDLTGPGLTTPQMYRRMLKEMKRHLAAIAEHKAKAAV